MSELYRVIINEFLGEQVLQLQAAAEGAPASAQHHEYQQFLEGLRVLRDGREAEPEQGGKRFRSLPDQYGDLSDCAEIKIPVFQEVSHEGYEFGPSHRMIYREFDGTPQDPIPVREVVAFAPRKDGRSFRQAQANLGRAVSVSLPYLGEDSVIARDSRSEPPAPIRQPLPRELAVRLSAVPRTGSSRTRAPLRAPGRPLGR